MDQEKLKTTAQTAFANYHDSTVSMETAILLSGTERSIVLSCLLEHFESSKLLGKQ